MPGLHPCLVPHGLQGGERGDGDGRRLREGQVRGFGCEPSCPGAGVRGEGGQKVPLQLVMAKTRHKSPRMAMSYVQPGAAAITEVTSLLGPPRRSHSARPLLCGWP